MSPRATARASLPAIVASALSSLLACVFSASACQGQLRLEDDGGAPISMVPGEADAGGGVPEASAVAVGPDSAPPSICTKDAECGLASLHCDVVSGSCVACVTDDQCKAGEKRRCDAALHRCVECGVDGDCGTGKVCVPGTRRCATSCQQLSDCVFLGDFCDTTKHICARCTDDSICTADSDTPICSAVDDCVECVTDATCPAAKPRCDRARGACVQCLGAADCASAARLCDPTTSVCVTGP